MDRPGADPRGMLGALLRKLRTDAGRTQEELGSDVRRQLNSEGRRANDATARSSVSRFEKGDATPSEAVVRAILTVTDANAADARRALSLLEQIAKTVTAPPPDNAADTALDDTGAEELQNHPSRRSSAGATGKRSAKLWLISAAADVVALGVVSVFLVATEPTPLESPRPVSASAPSKPCTPPKDIEEVTGTPSSTVVSGDGSASAEFYRDQGRFALIDERADWQSAVLMVRIDGKLQKPWSNCYGKTGKRRKDGIMAPPKIIDMPGFDKNSVVEFRACVAEGAVDIIDNSCGDWRVDQPR